MLEEGTYDNCRLLGAVYTSGEYGEQVALEIEISEGVKRTVFLSMQETPMDSGIIPFSEWTVPVLEHLEFKGDFGAPAFGKTEGISCYCKHKQGEKGTKEKWYVNVPGRGFTPEPAAQDITRRANARYKAMVQGAGKPAGKPTTPPGRGAAAPSKPPASAPSRPAPSRSAPTRSAPAEKPWDKDRAWEYWSEVEASGTSKGFKCDPEKFFEAIDGVAKGRDEGDLTSDDWKKVAEVADIPF
jgi:hypothetical protein